MSPPTPSISIVLDQHTCQVPTGVTVAAALGLWTQGIARHSVQGDPRGAFCGMGVCQECRVLVNGQRRLACQTVCTPGMVVQTDASIPLQALP